VCAATVGVLRVSMGSGGLTCTLPAVGVRQRYNEFPLAKRASKLHPPAPKAIS